MILARRPWTSQPQVAARVDWSNPLTRGLCFLVNYADPSLRNLATGDYPTLEETLAHGVGLPGRTGYATSQPGIASWPGVITTSTGDGLGAFTLLSLSAPIVESNRCALLSQADGIGYIEQCYLLANTDAVYASNAGWLTFGSSYGLTTALTGLIDGGWHCYVVTRTSGTSGEHVYAVDGRDAYAPFTESTGDIFFSAASARIYASGIKSYTDWTRAHPHAVQAAWNRYLTATERSQVSRNPWQLFERPSRRLWAPSGAAPSASRPSADISVTGWAASTGTDLYAMLDEGAYDDADYIYSNVSGISDAVFGIAPTMAAGDHTLNFRAFTNTGTCQQRVRLQDSGGSSVGVTGYSTVTATPQTFSLPITLTGTAARAVIETIP
jgi:hypothetical protein